MRRMIPPPSSNSTSGSAGAGHWAWALSWNSRNAGACSGFGRSAAALPSCCSNSRMMRVFSLSVWRVRDMPRFWQRAHNDRGFSNGRRSGGLHSSGIVEGLNLRVGQCMRKAYGHRSFEPLQVSLFQTLGDLPEPVFSHTFCGRTFFSDYCDMSPLFIGRHVGTVHTVAFPLPADDFPCSSLVNQKLPFSSCRRISGRRHNRPESGTDR